MATIFECHIIAKKKQEKKKKEKANKKIYLSKEPPRLFDIVILTQSLSSSIIGLLRYCHFKVLAILTSFSNDPGDINSHKFERTPFKHHADQI